MPAQLDCDVLVVGAGPTGVTLGLLLARNGVQTLVIDKEADIYPLPRAAHIDHEIMRIFQELGLANEVMATCRRSARYDFLTAKREILLRFEGMDKIGPGGWPAGNMIHQPSIEALLRKAARSQNNLSLMTPCAFLSYEERDGYVEVKVVDPEGERILRARYVIGADGARSPVRAAAVIELDDLQFDEPWLVIDAIVHDESRLPDANLQICDPSRPTTCVLMGSGRHRWEFMMKPGESADEVREDAFVAELLKPWHVEGAISIERTAVYRFNAKVAKTWRKHAVLLAGDAAHLMPPFAGQGMCSGLRDAANLAWKLTAVIAGSSDRVLDSYQSEREPHVRTIIAMAMMMGRTVCITDPAAAQARDESMLAARAAGSSPDGSMAFPPLQHGHLLQGSSGAGAYFPQLAAANDTTLMLDEVLGAGPWLITRARISSNDPPRMKVFALDAPELAPFAQGLDHWLSRHSAEAALVRPDRYVFGTGAPEQLISAWAAAS